MTKKNKEPLLGVKLGSGVHGINWRRDAPSKDALPEVNKKIIKDMIKNNNLPEISISLLDDVGSEIAIIALKLEFLESSINTLRKMLEEQKRMAGNI
jgi:hypothetical protein